MELKKIKEIFSFEKGSLQSSKCTAGEYNFITASSEWKTHNSFDYECEALIVAVAASGSLGRVHYVNDKFISSDLCFVLKPKDSHKFPVNLEFYYSIFKSLKEELVKSTATGTAKKSINKTNFGNYVIPYYNIEEQNRLKPVFEKVADNSEKINQELSNQKRLVSKLKQAILQEAIQGKLTQEWREQNPNIEPASELLEHIKAEKEQLIKDKKVRKGKRQQSNDLGDFKLEIPSEWEYPELDDISVYITDGTHQTPTYTEKGRMFLSAQNVKPFKFMPEKHKYVSEEAYQGYINNRKTEKGDLLLGRVGAGIGETAVVDQDLDFAIYVSLGLVKTFKEDTDPNYLAIVFNSPYGILYAKGNISSKGGSAGNFNLGRIRSFPIPFPPLEEQKTIVEKVEILMQKCNAIEQEIIQSEQHANMLMQAVLKEAFENKTENTEEYANA